MFSVEKVGIEAGGSALVVTARRLVVATRASLVAFLGARRPTRARDCATRFRDIDRFHLDLRLADDHRTLCERRRFFQPRLRHFRRKDRRYRLLARRSEGRIDGRLAA